MFHFFYQAGEQRPGVLEDTLINRLWSGPRGSWQCEEGSIRASQWRCGMNGSRRRSGQRRRAPYIQSQTLHTKMWKTSVIGWVNVSRFICKVHWFSAWMPRRSPPSLTKQRAGQRRLNMKHCSQPMLHPQCDSSELHRISNTLILIKYYFSFTTKKCHV